MHTLSYISHRDKMVQLYELALVGIRWWHLRVAVASWLRTTAVESWSLTSELSLSCAPPTAGG